ncbi:hypothetical protein [Sporosarcina sp. JAI121]|uniref:hypothetical protein n=1 Tax=Sporosarcina sp. JAI121 TaxID=2723064 RepID=UPI0015C95CD9|nr:hypothetical protein [Sporosarcina sp. JAI121]NYF23568.1 hypothetical protein [Sporosarcina sp. JAI121]
MKTSNGFVIAGMEFLKPGMKRVLHFATPIAMEIGTDVRWFKGTTKRIWMTFLTGEGETVKQSFLHDSNFHLLSQLKNATLGTEKREYSITEMIGQECVIEVVHDYSGETYSANIIGIYNKNEYVEESDEDEIE